jgi:glucokinase
MSIMRLGIDIGATRVRALVSADQEVGVDIDGDNKSEIIRKRIEDLLEENEGSEKQRLLDGVKQLIWDVCDEIGIHPSEIRTAGIGSIGPLDMETGSIAHSSNLPRTVENLRIVDAVKDRIDSQDVVLLNDSTAGLLGERFHQETTANPLNKNMIYLTLSTGISAGVSVDAEVLGGNVGEVGHWVLDPEGTLTCGCGEDGHWEAYCGGSNIPDYSKHLYEKNKISTDLPIHSNFLSTPEIFRKYGNDNLATLTISRVQDWNEIGVVNLIHAFEPSVISIGGGVAISNKELLIQDLNDRIQDSVIVNPPEIRSPVLGGDIVARGALGVAFRGDY